MRGLLVLITAFALVWPVFALEPGEALKDPALERRAREISKELRCLVCQNQSIDDSDAPLARDLRRIVRERLTKGDSNRQVVMYITARYGDFVLLRPPVKPVTWLLWFGPLLLFLIGVGGLMWRISQRRRIRQTAPVPLSEAEKRKLRRLEQPEEGET